MKPHRTALLCLGLTIASFTGCRSSSGPAETLDSTKYTIESTDKFVLLDQASSPVAVSCTGLQEHILPDGRLQVAANVKNRENRFIKLLVDCVFKDEQGVSKGDEAAVKTLGIAGNSTEAVSFTSVNNLARKYTIRVREVR
jgi:uncharacterized protein YcfL